MIECRNRSENLINRKLSNFYIETVIQFFFQLRKVFFFSIVKKKQTFFFENFDFFRANFLDVGVFTKQIFLADIFFWDFFLSPVKKYFFGLEKKIRKKIRCRKFIRFDLWNFQSDSGTLLRGRCKYVSPKVQQSGHIQSISATRPLANLRSSPPPCQLWGKISPKPPRAQL